MSRRFVDPRSNPILAQYTLQSPVTGLLDELTGLHEHCGAGRLYEIERWIERGQLLQLENEAAMRGRRRPFHGREGTRIHSGTAVRIRWPNQKRGPGLLDVEELRRDGRVLDHWPGVSRRSVTKGKAWEREVARLLSEATGLSYARILSECRDSNVGDVDAPGSPFTVQCKVGARPNPSEALREAVEASEGTGRVPVAIIRKNGAGCRPSEDFAVLRIGDFLSLLHE